MSANHIARASVLAMLALTSGPVSGQDKQIAKTHQEYFHPFKGTPQERDKLLLVGPNAEQYVKLEPEGVRITLPRGVEGESKGHGVNSGIIVQGDFEITASFEVLQDPEPAEAGAGTKVHLLIQVNRPPFDLAGFSRHVSPKKGARFTAWHNEWNVTAKKNKQEIKWFDVKGLKWRFRLARTDAVLSYFLAEEGEDEFRLLQRFAFVKDDVKDIRLTASTGGPLAALDVRVSDLHIRAESIPNLAEVQARQALAPADAQPDHVWLWLALGVMLFLLLVLALAFWLSRRQAARTQDGGQ